MSGSSASKVRCLVEALAAAGVTLVAYRYLSAFPADDFRSTLLIVPWVVLGLVWTERWGKARAGRSLVPELGSIEGVALVLLWVLTARHSEIGLVGLPPFLASAWFLLLAQRVARQVVALRPCLGKTLPRRPSLVFAFLPLLVYLALQPWMGEQRGLDGDEPYYLLLAHSIAFDADVDLSNNYIDDWRGFTERELQPQPGDPVGPEGQLRSRHSALLPLVLAPVYRLFGLAGVRGLFALASALLAWMVLRLAYRYRPQAPSAALWAWAMVGLGPPLLLFSYQVWVEVPAALLLAVALDRVHSIRGDGKGNVDHSTAAGEWTLRQLLMLLVPLALLPWLKLRFGLISLGLLVLAIGRGRPDRRSAVRLGAFLAVIFGGLLIYNSWRYGHPLRMHSWWELGSGTTDLSAALRGALGLFYDSAFGLFGVAPLWLLLLPAVVRCWQKQRALLTDFALVAGPYLILLWPRSEWYGGWSPAFRYGLVFLPLLAVMLLPLNEDRRRPGLRLGAAILGIGTLFLLTLWVVMPGWTYNFADGGTHLLNHLGHYLGADVCRFFPSLVRPRMASWVWPLVSLLWIPICLYTRQRRSGGMRSATTIATACAVLLISILALVGLARRWPTSTVEVEDGYVTKYLGGPFPPRWSVQRADYRGGWLVAAGGHLSAPINVGGEQATVVIHAIAVGEETSYVLQVAAGSDILATEPVTVGTWQRIELASAEWPSGAPLVLSSPATVEGRGGVIVDRVELEWR